jgi:cell wall-associated NlpC family hydrolase
MVLAAVAPFAAADAQSIGDLQAQAAEIQGQIASLRDEVETHAEEYNRARARADADQAELQQATGDLDSTKTEFGARRQQLSDYAVQAYVDGGDLPAVDGLLGGDPDAASRRFSYLRTASGDRRTLLDRLEVTQQDLDAKMRRVSDAKSATDADAQAADGARDAASKAQSDLEDLLGRVQGELGDLVRQEEERQAAAQAAAAQATAAAAAAARPQVVAAAADDTPAAPSDTSAAPAQSDAPRALPMASVGASSVSGAALQAAYSQLGVPYVYGGGSPGEGFDCSGLVQWAFGQAGRSLSHAADWQRDESQPISEGDLQPGDLVFYGEPPDHVAMYVGGGQIINAPYTGEVVRVQDLYYSSKPMSFGRIN